MLILFAQLGYCCINIDRGTIVNKTISHGINKNEEQHQSSINANGCVDDNRESVTQVRFLSAYQEFTSMHYVPYCLIYCMILKELSPEEVMSVDPPIVNEAELSAQVVYIVCINYWYLNIQNIPFVCCHFSHERP